MFFSIRNYVIIVTHHNSIAARLLSLNVRGLRDKIKRRHLFHIFRQKRYDIVMLQETHCTQTDVKIWTSQWGGDLYYSNGTNNSKGVITLIRKNLDYKLNKEISDTNGRQLILDISFNEQSLVICNICTPNEDVPDFFTKTMASARACNSAEHIICGDFNLVLNPNLDRLNTVNNNNKSMSTINDLLNECEMCDVWRVRNPASKKYTWHKDSRASKASRIDFFLISNSLIANVTECDITSSFGLSDHSAVSLVLTQNTSPRGMGYWKFNNTLLYDADYVTQMNDLILKVLEVGSLLPPDEKWEYLKTEIALFSKSFSVAKAKLKKEQMRELELRINRLQCQIDLLPFPHEQADDELDKALADYRVVMEDKVKASIFRNKCKWHVEGERSSKYYFALERKNYKNKTVSALQKENGEVTRDMHVISQEMVKYFSDLYSYNHTVCFDLQHLPGAKLTDEQTQFTNQPLSIEELALSLHSMPNGKTCGCDGLNTEFYKMFWEKLKTPYYQAVLTAIDKGVLHSSAL